MQGPRHDFDTFWYLCGVIPLYWYVEYFAIRDIQIHIIIANVKMRHFQNRLQIRVSHSYTTMHFKTHETRKCKYTCIQIFVFTPCGFYDVRYRGFTISYFYGAPMELLVLWYQKFRDSTNNKGCPKTMKETNIAIYWIHLDSV